MKMGLQICFFTISTFEMSGKYGFIRTFSGNGVLFRVASGKTVAKIINKIDLDIAIPGRDKKSRLCFGIFQGYRRNLEY